MIERHPSIDPVHPGQILREDILPALAMSKTAVAAALGVSRQTLYDILNEQQPVTAEMAVRFGKLFGNGAGFWANLQRSYDLAVAERTVDVSGIPTLAVRGSVHRHPRQVRRAEYDALSSSSPRIMPGTARVRDTMGPDWTR